MIAIGPTFASVLDDSFDQIRSSGEGNAAIMLRRLGAEDTIGKLTVSHHRREALLEHVQRIAEVATRTIESPHDRHHVERRLKSVHDALASSA